VPRPPTPVGSFGAISHVQLPDGTWSARSYIRDADGKLRLVKRRARSRAAAERVLKTALTERNPPTQGTVSSATRIRDLAERWYTGVRQDVTEGMQDWTARPLDAPRPAGRSLRGGSGTLRSWVAARRVGGAADGYASRRRW
jgi:hypothetical protein